MKKLYIDSTARDLLVARQLKEVLTKIDIDAEVNSLEDQFSGVILLLFTKDTVKEEMFREFSWLTSEFDFSKVKNLRVLCFLAYHSKERKAEDLFEEVVSPVYEDYFSEEFKPYAFDFDNEEPSLEELQEILFEGYSL
ncbi:MAG: hypothetical protein K5694_03435 [Bacilli bacterium]|nr:hypothetical protein [Bacilli bacterium]